MRKLISAVFPLLFSLSVSLALYQLIPGEQLTTKKSLLLLGVFLLVFLAGLALLRVLEFSRPLSRKAFCFFLLISMLLSALLTGIFHLSFPQKEICLSQQTIRLRVVESAETASWVRFLSLNNGYRGVSLSDFSQTGSWQRDDEQLSMLTGPANAQLIFSGKIGETVSLYFMRGQGAATIYVDWGDGTVETYALDTPNTAPESQQITHHYGATVARMEKWNFFINLYSVFILLTTFVMVYFCVLYWLLRRRTKRFAAFFLVLSICTLLMRVINSYDFPLGWDEGTYARAAMRYSEKIVGFKMNEIPDILYNHEHPAFIKLSFSIPASVDGREYFRRFGWNTINRADLGKEDYTIFVDRLVCAFYSLLTVQMLTYLIHPFAAFFFMIDSLASEYGAQGRLEAIPMLFSFLSVWFFERFLRCFTRRETAKLWHYLLASALFLGLTAASKVIYCVIAFAMILMVLDVIRRNPPFFVSMIKPMLIMAFCSLLFFFIFNPSLWHAPVERLDMMLNFHENYQEGASDIYPWWQPFAWVTRSVAHQSGRFFEKSPLARQPHFFFFSADELIFLLACFGAPQLFRKRRIYIYWFIFGMIFLMLWGTKWEQYGCINVVPICISAYFGCKRIAGWAMEKF